VRALKKLNLIEVNLKMSFEKVSESKEKLKKVKDNILSSSSKFLLMKQKLKNLWLLHSIIKTKLSKWYGLFIESKKFKKNNKFCQLWKNLSSIRNDIQNWMSGVVDSKINPNLKSLMSVNLFKKKNLVINEIMLQKSKQKLNKLQAHVEKQLNDIFYDKNDNLFQIYNYFCLNPNYSIDKFFELLESVFKKTIFNVIKGSLCSFSDDSRSFLLQDIFKIRDISKLKFEENKFVQSMNHLLKNLTKICENFQVILDCSKSDQELYKFFLSKKNNFYEIIEKKFSKTISKFTNQIREYNTKNLIYITLYNCLFLELIKFHFNVDYSKFLILASKNLVLESIKFKTLQNIKKIGILLGGDNWKRAALQNYNEFFSNEKLNERTPLFLKNLLTIFNDVKFFVNKNNIKDIFEKYIELFSINSEKNHNSFYMNFDEVKFDMLSEPLDNKTIILSSSTITLIKYLVDLIVDLAFYDNLTYEIFQQIFNIFDYYILAALKMFGDKKLLTQLFEEINIEEIKKKNKFENAIDLMLLQKKCANLKKYLVNTKKSLEILFEVEIDLIKTNYDYADNYESNEFYLPKFNSQIIINDNNIYSCMIENIILFESMISVSQVMKRILHFAKKIELDFQSKLIVEHIRKYDQVLEEIKFFFYKPICHNIFKIDPIMNKIISFKWDPKDSDNDFEFSEANIFIDNLFVEVCEKYEKLDLLSAGSLTEDSKLRFLDVILIHINEKLIDSFSKIKKCNSCGRSIMLKDIKFLKSKLEQKFNKE
jgi:hypothetical protein